MPSQENYATPPFEDAPGSTKEDWQRRLQGARRRGAGGRLEPDLKQQKLPEGNKTLLRLLSMKFGERYMHFFFDTEGNKKAANCVAIVDYKGDKCDICPACLKARDFGDQDHGGANTSHVYYFLCIMGKITEMLVRDKNDPTAEPEVEKAIIWNYNPIVFQCTSGLFNQINKRFGDADYPPKANGDATRYAFQIRKKSTGTQAKDVEYEANPYLGFEGDIGDIPKQVDMSLLPNAWLKVQKLCEPSDREFVLEKLGTPIKTAGEDAAQPERVESSDNYASRRGREDPIGEELELEDAPGSSAGETAAQSASEEDVDKIF